MEAVLTRDLAEQEITSWLDYKRVSPKDREDNKDAIERMIDSVMYGYLSMDADSKEFTHTLSHPIGVNGSIRSLNYKARITAEEQTTKMNGVKASNFSALVTAGIAAIAGQPVAVIGKLDTEDRKIAQAIATFFF